MPLDFVFVGLVVLYFAAWVVGGVEGILFRRFLRREHPDLSEVHAAGLLRSSILDQFRSLGWILRRRYREVQRPNLTRRGDLHLRFLVASIAIIVLSVAGILIVSPHIAGRTQDRPENAEPANDPQHYDQLNRLIPEEMRDASE